MKIRSRQLLILKNNLKTNKIILKNIRYFDKRIPEIKYK